MGQAEEGEKLRGKCRKRIVNSKLVEINRHDCWELRATKRQNEKRAMALLSEGSQPVIRKELKK